MIVLDSLLACPVCHAQLFLDQIRQDGTGQCANCERVYRYHNQVFDFTPLPPPEGVKDVWQIWEELQKNGLVSYTCDPMHNLSVGERADAQAFARFANLSGLTLDLGCGPQRELPVYATQVKKNYIGIDPLAGEAEREFEFMQGIAEYLPFRATVFDHVLFATSLDHMLNPQRALAEAKRVLKAGGTLNLWFFDATKQPSKLEYWLYVWKARLTAATTLIKAGKIGQLGRSIITGSPIRPQAMANAVTVAPAQAYLDDLTIPPGAIDYFHFFHPTQRDVLDWLKTLNLQIAKIKIYKFNHVFVQAKS